MTNKLIITGTKDASGIAAFGGRGGMGCERGERERSAGLLGHNLGDSTER
jgi:hypothetical protein